MKDYKISGSIVVYNKPEDAYKTVQSVLANTDEDFSLYIIDNDSAEGINPMLREHFTANYIDLDKNIGFGKAHNMVLDKLDSKYHFIINPDILINEETISKLCCFMDSHQEVSIACPKVLHPDGTIQYIAKQKPGLLSLISRRVHIKALKKLEDEYLMKYADQDKECEIDFCTGCFFVIRTEVFKKIGGFDPEYFLYFEDADITMKAKQLGKAYYAPSASVVHFWHRETASSKRQFFLQVKSMFIYFKKWGFKLK
ncbi:MAG: glycosyltransferase family 2 protein [Oscillospiraceae bacterium]